MLVANQNEIALWSLKKGTAHRFKYILKNTGNSSIRIENISVGCGSCTQASTDQSVVTPGNSTEISVVFTPNSLGLQSKSVTIKTTSGELKLRFSAEVK